MVGQFLHLISQGTHERLKPSNLKSAVTRLLPTGNPLYLKLFQIALRFIAWFGSCALFAALFVALLLINLNSVTAPLVKYASAKIGTQISYDEIGLGWVDQNLIFRVGNLRVRRDNVKEQLDFAVEQIEVRFEQPSTEGDRWEIAEVEVLKPTVVSHRRIQMPTTQPQQKPAVLSEPAVTTGAAFLSYVRKIDVIDGKYALQLDDGDRQLDFTGAFGVIGHSQDGLSNVSVSLTTNGDSEPAITLNLASSPHRDGKILTNLEIIFKSVEIAPLASVFSNNPRVAAMNLADLETRIDAIIYAHWTEDTLDLIHFSVEARDPNLDGAIPDVKHASLSAAGKIELDRLRAKQINVDFELESVDLAAALALIPGAFPPKFHNHASTRLRSLWLTGLSGRLRADPQDLFKPEGDWELSARGEFSNYTYQFSPKWPPLENASGVYKINGKTINITGQNGSVYGYPFQSAVAQINDFSIPDPVMSMNIQWHVPVNIAPDLFGKKGIVSPGKLNWVVTGEGEGAIGMAIDVPLRRGKEFTLVGDILLTDTKMTTVHGVEVNDIAGRLQFSRYGITAGDLTGQMLDGPFAATFVGSGSQGDFKIVGQSSGTVAAGELQIVLGDSIADQLSGDVEWDSTFAFESHRSEVNISATLVDVVSTLPFPMLKGAGVDMPLDMTIRTEDRSARTVELSLGEHVHASVDTILRDQRWYAQSGAVVVGDRLPLDRDESGMVVAVNLPQLDYGQWSKLLTAREDKGEFNLASALKTVSIKADELILPGERKFQNAQVLADKTPTHWEFELDADSIHGSARYVNSEFTQEGESPRLDIDLALCHIPAASQKSTANPTNPMHLPALSVRCTDTRYGQYFLGESTIEAQPNGNSWRITRAQFDMPSATLHASGDWFHNQSSKLAFKLNSVDFGRTMDDLGFPARFERGNMEINGTLEWDAALTQWATHRASGTVEVNSTEGSIISDSNAEALRVVGALNYDTIFKRFSNDIVDVLDKDGILYDHLRGSATLTDGVFEVDGVFIEGPAVSMAMTGTTDWNNREHNLTLGVEPQIKNSLTTLATLLINPVTGALVYVGGKLADQVKLKFSYHYDVTGPWDKPVVQLVQNNNRVGSTSAN